MPLWAHSRGRNLHFAICNRTGDPPGERIFEPCLRKVAKNCYLCDIKQTSYLWNLKEPFTK